MGRSKKSSRKKSKGGKKVKRVIRRKVGRSIVTVKYRKGCKPKVSVRKK